MSDTSYDVRIYKTDVYVSKKKGGQNTYWVRWKVARKLFKEPFKGSGLADSFRSDLVAAARKGEAFYVLTGLPVSMKRANHQMSWYEFACSFVDMKWPRVAATTRRTHAEAMTAVTTSLFNSDRGKPDDLLIRSALTRWAFNTNLRNSDQVPDEVHAALRWVAQNTMPVQALNQPDVLRRVLDQLAIRLDGKPMAPSVVSRRRKILITAAEYAVEKEILAANPVPALKWAAPKGIKPVDKRSVANPVQARSLMNAVKGQGRVGRRMVAFFGCLYFAALRPEEAAALHLGNLDLPAKGWGEFHLEGAEPYAGKDWTDSGEHRDQRQLKQRDVGETRTVPVPPELTEMLHRHLAEFGTGERGRLFVGERNKKSLPKLTILRTWQQAREMTFTPEVCAGPLAASPYDLRHAAVSTWLNSGVPPTQVAEWAGHSVEILLKIYAKCLDGGTVAAQRRIDSALGHRPD